jgi:thiamine transport system permease protein
VDHRVGSRSYTVGGVIAAGIPVVFVAIFFLYPVASIVGLGFADGVSDVLTRPRTLRLVGLTLAQAAIASIVCVAVGLPIAHVLYRLLFRGQRLLRALVIVPFVLPTVVVGVAFRTLLRGTPLDGTFVAILLALVFFNVAVVVRTVGTAWQGLDSRMEEAARTLGASWGRAFVTVTLPRLGPSIVAAASIVFLFCATAFGVVLVLGGSQFGTIETEIWLLTTQFLDLKAASMLSVVQLLIVVALLAIAARTPSRSERFAVRPRTVRRVDAAAVTVTLVTAALLAAPLVSLLVRSLQTSQGWGFGNYLALAGRGTRNALSIPVWAALGNSLIVALVATLIAMTVGLVASLLVSRRPRSAVLRRLLTLLDGGLMLPLGVSAVTVGFGFLIALNAPPLDLRSSPILVPVAQALVAVPLVIRSIVPVLRGVPQRMRESAAMLGAGPWRVLFSIDLALAGRAAVAGAGLAFAVALGEFGATSFLSRPAQATLPVVIFRLIGLPGGDNFGMALAASVILALVVVVVVAFAERLRPGVARA